MRSQWAPRERPAIPVTPTTKTEPASTAGNDGSDLIGRARLGDAAAFDGICREHTERLLRQAIALSRDVEAAEDLVQETLVEAWRSLPGYRGGCRLFTWLCRILIHRHLNSRRRRWPAPFSLLFGNDRESTERFLDGLQDAAPLPGSDIERAERAARVLRSLARLPAKQREVVHLRFYAGDSLEGIAAALGCSVGTVKSRLHHGLERLRQMKALSED